MNFSKECGFFKSANGTDRIAYYLYKPASEVRAIVQIVHGMCEYCGRYEDFISYLCANGIMVCCHDHLGHGASARDEEHLGYFAPERGWQYLAKDTVNLTKMIRERYPKFPYYILGHSMGSLVTRTVLAKYGFYYDGAVIMGTVNIRIGTNAGILLTRTLCKVKGDFYRSRFIDELVFGLSNVKIDDPESEYSWISRDTDIVEAYEKNPLCNFHFSRRDWAEKIDKDLPVFICSGAEDPVGLYGRGPQTVFNALNDAGLYDIEMKLYSGARHEILNETNRAEVYEDLLEWLNNHIASLTRK